MKIPYDTLREVDQVLEEVTKSPLKQTNNIVSDMAFYVRMCMINKGIRLGYSKEYGGIEIYNPSKAHRVH